MAGNPEERHALAVILKNLLLYVAETADPDQALNAWEHFVSSGIQRRTLFQFLAQSPRMLHQLCTIFGNSPAMSETLIRDPMLIYWLEEIKTDSYVPTSQEIEARLRDSLLAVNTYERKCDAIRRFRRREMLRLGLRDLLHVGDVIDTASALSNLATVVIQVVYDLVQAELLTKYGLPHHQDRQGQWLETGFVVMGMGKLGGGELNYSSDVDLVYLYENSTGHTRGNKKHSKVSNEEYFEKLAREMTQVMTEGTDEGSIFRVDLRLRPEGDVGGLAHALDDAVQYYRTRGRDWERMAFVKSYPIAGKKQVGTRFLRRIRSFVVGKTDEPQEKFLTSVRALKAKIHTKLIRRGEERRHVKLGIGGIREVEFLVQTQQLLHAKHTPRVLERNTLKALLRLQQAHILPETTVRQLTTSYRFLRDLEHKLQIVNEMQTHTLPRALQEVARCAVRMGYQKHPSYSETAQCLMDDYERHTASVHQLYLRYIGS